MKNKTFFIADCHFGDDNIIKFEGRPFENSSVMDEFMILSWNAVVAPEDTVIVVGDFFTKLEPKYVASILKRLNGNITLVVGNHDTNINLLRRHGVHAIEYSLVFEKYWIVSHEPAYMTENAPYANIYGHVHNNPNYKNNSCRGMCVCTERLSYTPIDFEKLREIVLAQ